MKTVSDLHSRPLDSIRGSGQAQGNPFKALQGSGAPQGKLREIFREGCAVLDLDVHPAALEQLWLYYQELIRWNARINLTGYKDATAIIGNLFMDSLACTKAFAPEQSLRDPSGPFKTLRGTEDHAVILSEAKNLRDPNNRCRGSGEPYTILDVGSGAGFPGLPIKIFSPEHHVTLLDSNLKKVAFLHHMVGLLPMESIHVKSNRVEDFSAQRACHGKFDWIFMKALRLGKGFSYIMRPLLSEYGNVVFHRAKPMRPDQRVQGFRVIEEISYTLPFGLGERVLSIARPCP